MDPTRKLQRRKSSNPGHEIQQWQVNIDYADETTVPTGVIAALYDASMSFLQTMMATTKKQETTPSYYQSLQKSLAALHFWGLDFGVTQGELDMALQYPHCLYDTVLTVLVSIGELLSIGIINVLSSKDPELVLKASKIGSLIEEARFLLDEPLDIPEYIEQNLDGLSKTLENMIDSLRVLKSSLDSVLDHIPDEEKARPWVILQDRPAYEYYVELISLRFPAASLQLSRDLGKANWERYNYVSKLHDNAQGNKDSFGTEKTQSEFQDSGIGSSVPPQTDLHDDSISTSLKSQLERAATIVSSRADASHKRLPSLPVDARSGNPFKCEVCHRMVQIRRTKEWKKHIFEDICAYTCIIPGCAATQTLFKDRKTMTEHLTLRHGIVEDSGPHACPLCSDEIIGGLDLIFPSLCSSYGRDCSRSITAECRVL